ncbi:plasmid replication, integration and excision activator [Carbonactinospora thermoautotrophica]|uniref:plasmid replication, integration and excision activator n=1 Tax=Carbonactinospora thermoautotrophica TaxID=1469144 RepID=UPI0022710848|nr:plasmid replication, integration and excision activator [Carbonactinospora thermoautotrophica]MCX9193535.1 plasmid replication, integration and excision activator [Carbonactinospora thermoautotrophica]
MAIKGAIPVRFEDVFPHGAYAVNVTPVLDFERSKGGAQVQARDRVTNDPVWAVEVYDADSEVRHQDRSVKVKIAAAQQPVLPDAMPGLPFRPIEFEGMTVRPYVTDKGRLAYSYSARGVKTPGGKPAPAAASVKGQG